MGLLKKIFKPVSKVLDKIIPNELKPILPYAAAFAPYAMPGIMGIGGNTMLSRALMSGGLNIGAQLAQEGSEGDINLLSAGLGGLQGAMTAPGKVGYGTSDVMIEGAQPGAAGILKAKADAMQPGMMKSGLEALSGGSKYLTGAAETLQSNPFSVEGLKAAAIPFAQGTADVMYAEGQRDLKDLAKDVVDDMGGGYTDDAYRAAIRKSMTAYGATEEEIIDAIEAAGYRSGGRVGLMNGGEPDFISMREVVENVNEDQANEQMAGISNALNKMADGGRVGFKNAGLAALPQSPSSQQPQYITKKSDVDIIHRVYEEGGNEGLQAYLADNPDLKEKYVIVESYGGELTVMPNKLHPDNMDMDNIMIIKGNDGNVIDMSNMLEGFTMNEKKAKGGRVGMVSGGALKGLWNAAKTLF